jgi:hypothetical protein
LLILLILDIVEIKIGYWILDIVDIVIIVDIGYLIMDIGYC